jgi:hypothetical protein
MNIIEISGKRYEVRKQNGKREVFVNRQWISDSDFVEYLIGSNQMDAFFDLVKLGLNTMKK